MKIELNIKEIKSEMKKNGIKSYKKLAIESGIKPYTFYQAKYRGSISLEMLWLIADRLSCKVDDLIVPNWEENR